MSRNEAYYPPRPGCFRLTRGVRLVPGEAPGDKHTVAICEYPLRVVKLNATMTRLLTLCMEERTCEQLSRAMSLSVKRTEALCDQLRWKGLLEAGPLLPLTIWPSVSIIIPAYNRVRELERCLRSLLTLDYPLDCLEVIVLDDASTDGTYELLQRMKLIMAERGLAFRFFSHEKQRGAAAARNSATATAQHDLIAYIDSDCVASPSWLTDLVPALQDTRIAAVGGMIRAYECHSMPGRYEDVRSSLFVGKWPQQIRLDGPFPYLPTANLLVRRTIWQQIDGFGPLIFGEDVDFCRRMLQSGATILYLPYGVVYHDYRTSLWDFLRTRASYASAEAVLLQRHPSERRILLLPPEQTAFATFTLASAWGVGKALNQAARTTISKKAFVTHKPSSLSSISLFFPLSAILIAIVLAIFGTRARLHKVQEQQIPLGTFSVFKATLRGNLSYTYHLCRHLTRYYTLLLLFVSLLIPPLFMLTCILCGIVIVVDYVRLRPDMGFGEYAFCSLLDDCAYEIGVFQGCLQHRTWKPMFPIVKRRL